MGEAVDHKVSADLEGIYVLTREIIIGRDHLEVKFQGIIAPYTKPIEGKPLVYIQIESPRHSDLMWKLRPIPGFTLTEYDPLVCDSITGVANRNGDADIGKLRGTPVFLRFHVVNSKLWGFRFAAE